MDLLFYQNYAFFYQLSRYKSITCNGVTTKTFLGTKNEIRKIDEIHKDFLTIPSLNVS